MRRCSGKRESGKGIGEGGVCDGKVIPSHLYGVRLIWGHSLFLLLPSISVIDEILANLPTLICLPKKYHHSIIFKLRYNSYRHLMSTCFK